MRKLPILLFLLILLPAFGAVAGSTNSIFANGDFEESSSTEPLFPPWQVSGGVGGFINEPTQVASGGNCVIIGGLADAEMWQDLDTQPGQAYRFSFYERGDDPAQLPRSSLLNVYWDNQLVGTFNESNQDLAWNYHAFAVVAGSATTRITFQEASGTIGGYGHPSLDLVSVVAIPEPSSMQLLGAGIAMFAGNRIRNWKRRRASFPQDE